MEPVNLSILVVNCKQYIPSYNWYFCKSRRYFCGTANSPDDICFNEARLKEFNDSENYYGEGNDKEGIKIKNSKKKIEEINNNYYYNLESKEPQMKTDLMKNYEWKLFDLLEMTKD